LNIFFVSAKSKNTSALSLFGHSMLRNVNDASRRV